MLGYQASLQLCRKHRLYCELSKAWAGRRAGSHAPCGHGSSSVDFPRQGQLTVRGKGTVGRSRKPTLAAAGSAVRRGGRLRIPEPTPQPAFRVPLLVSLIASESGILRAPERLPRGKLDRGRLHLGRRAEIPRGRDGARRRRGAEFRTRGKLKPRGENWLFRTQGRHSLGPTGE